jgi:nucleoside-diphosphate-sugar epimerase
MGMRALNGVSESELGSLSPKRDRTFVGDTARAFLLAATAGDIHVGQGSSVSMRELTELCLKVAGSRAKIVSV